MRSRGLPAALIARLAEAGETRFVDQAAWQAHLGRLAIASPPQIGVAVIQDPVQIATEGGSVGQHPRAWLPAAMPWC